MKKLRKTLAIVLAVVMLATVVPFTAFAETTPTINYTVVAVNGEPYSGTTPILGGDSVTVGVIISRDASLEVQAWQAGFNFDSDALIYGGLTYTTNWMDYGSLPQTEDGYYSIGSVSITPITAASETVAYISFTVNSSFTGAAEFLAGLGPDNYIGYKAIVNNKPTIKRLDANCEGCTINVTLPVDKTELKNQLDAAALLDEEAYTPSTWAVLASAVSAGQAVYDNALADQNSIDTAAGNIETAINGLVNVAEKAALQEAINNARIELDKDCYDDESVAAMNDILDTAEEVLDDDEATQDAVNEQVAIVNDAVVNVLKLKKFQVVFYDYDNVNPYDTQTVEYGKDATRPANDPVKPSDEEFEYTFNGWVGSYTNVTEDLEIYPNFTEKKRSYTVTFYKEDGETVIDKVTKEYGTVLTDEDIPKAPDKPADKYNTYEFTGWSPAEIAPVTSDASYIAQYEGTPIPYTIKFVNYDNEPLYTYENLHYGDTVEDPVTKGHIETPVRPDDEENTYTYTGWDSEITAVDGNKVYKAQYSSESALYTVKFVNYNGDVLKSYDLAYGSELFDPIVRGDIETPTRPDSELYSYTYKGWSPELDTTATVTTALTFTADYTPVPLPAIYDSVYDAIARADALNADDYTSVSFARVTAAKAAVDYTYTREHQDEVNAMATAIDNAINALVSTKAYDAVWAECAAITDNDDELYTPASYALFREAMDAIGEKKDFNTEDATQAQVDAATKELTDALDLLVTQTLVIDGAKDGKDDLLSGTAILVAGNVNSVTTSLFANDGGAGIASLEFYDLNGNLVTNPKKSLGTGFTVKLIQGGAVKATRTIIVYGDIDGDGQATIADIALTRKMAASTDGFADYQIEAAKCGGDSVSVAAVTDIVKAI